VALRAVLSTQPVGAGTYGGSVVQRAVVARHDFALLACVRVERHAHGTVGVSLRVHRFVFEDFHQEIETRGYKRAKNGPDPVDPVIRVERSENDAWPECSCWIDTSTCVVDAPAEEQISMEPSLLVQS
jgi:hypothetical protein